MKGVATAWSPMLHSEYLGPTTTGLRTHTGTQLLRDVMLWQRRGGGGGRLRISSDVDECFPSLP